MTTCFGHSWDNTGNHQLLTFVCEEDREGYIESYPVLGGHIEALDETARRQLLVKHWASLQRFLVVPTVHPGIYQLMPT